MCYGSGIKLTQAEQLARYASAPGTYTIATYTMPDATVITQVQDKQDDSSLFFVGDSNQPSNWKFGKQQAHYLGKQLLAHRTLAEVSEQLV